MGKQPEILENVRRVPLLKKQCPQCRKEFHGQPAKKFCSVSCRQKFVYYAHQEERRARLRRGYYAAKEKKAAKRPAPHGPGRRPAHRGLPPAEQ